MNKNKIKNQDIDIVETLEWIDSIKSVFYKDGVSRVEFFIKKLISESKKLGCHFDSILNTPYVNTISFNKESKYPGNLFLEKKIINLVRWNTIVMVMKAIKYDSSIGGHIGTFCSIAHIYEVGFNHFWKNNTTESLGDLIYFQGHTSPGIYARSFLENRFTYEQLNFFRRNVSSKYGLSSYPHPWLMPSYWQFPTVSLGLGPIQAIYQAYFLRYLNSREMEIKSNSNRKVWCICGDGEMDEPESVGALNFAVREKLNNLIFVINCNLQRLDGPVRGNSKIINELESIFLGIGWNVIKVIWSSDWDILLSNDKDNLLLNNLESLLDGDYQFLQARGGKFVREYIFSFNNKIFNIANDFSDDELGNLKYGGHDFQKIYSAFELATKTKYKPTVILFKTVKGYGLGDVGEALNIAHNVKYINDKQILNIRDYLNIPIIDKQAKELSYYKPNLNSDEITYLIDQRKKLGGFIPNRRIFADKKMLIPSLINLFEKFLKGTQKRKISTTMIYVEILKTLCRNKNFGKYIVPIVADEARSFGMESLFTEIGIFSNQGQLYKPVDFDQLLFYKESKNGQLLEEGITESGAFSAWLSAATSYSVNNLITIPFYIYYSMFGFQRIGDLIWAAGDARARGFLIGATSGKTTLNGEGLQHADGHSHILASNVPNCKSYDPSFGYEIAVIIHHGLKYMMENQQDVFYYITVTNENYEQPDIKDCSNFISNENLFHGIIKGMYKYRVAKIISHIIVELFACGSILIEVLAASDLLEKNFNVGVNVWSVTSFNELSRDGREISRWNMLNIDKNPKVPYVVSCLKGVKGPIIAVTDYVKNYPEQIREFICQEYVTLGTDGFGRSDTKSKLRNFFEIDRYYIIINVLKILVKNKNINIKVLKNAFLQYKIDLDKKYPMYM